MFYSLKFILVSHLFFKNNATILLTYIWHIILKYFCHILFCETILFYNKQKLFSNSCLEFQDEVPLMIFWEKNLVHSGNIVLVYIPLPLGESLIFCQDYGSAI